MGPHITTSLDFGREEWTLKAFFRGEGSVFMGRRESGGLISWRVEKEEVEWFKERREG